MKKLKNIHPGEILLEEFLSPMGISQNRLARDMQVPPRRINEIILEKRGITADTDLRLARALGTTEGFWLGLQADFDMEEQRKKIYTLLPKINNLASHYAENSKQGMRIAEPKAPYYASKKNPKKGKKTSPAK